jgi:hypothetical protein
MRHVTLLLDLFGSHDSRAQSERVLRLLLEVLTAANVVYLREHPGTPPLYSAGVRYEAERPHVAGAPIPEVWKSIPFVLRDRSGDCEDLACWRVAELLCAGVDAQPTFTWRQITPRLALYHILVRYGDGRTEDPSRRLGMK